MAALNSSKDEARQLLTIAFASAKSSSTSTKVLPTRERAGLVRAWLTFDFKLNQRASVRLTGESAAIEVLQTWNFFGTQAYGRAATSNRQKIRSHAENEQRACTR